MDDNIKKSFDRSRSLLFGLLQSCLLDGNSLKSCPLSRLRNSLSFDEKYHYTMRLSKDEVDKILEQHEECFNKRIITSVLNRGPG